MCKIIESIQTDDHDFAMKLDIFLIRYLCWSWIVTNRFGFKSSKWFRNGLCSRTMIVCPTV